MDIMAIKKDLTYSGLIRRKKELEDLIDLKTRRLAYALAGMSDSGLRRIERRDRRREKKDGGT